MVRASCYTCRSLQMQSRRLLAASSGIGATFVAGLWVRGGTCGSGARLLFRYVVVWHRVPRRPVLPVWPTAWSPCEQRFHSHARHIGQAWMSIRVKIRRMFCWHRRVDSTSQGGGGCLPRGWCHFLLSARFSAWPPWAFWPGAKPALRPMPRRGLRRESVQPVWRLAAVQVIALAWRANQQ